MRAKPYWKHHIGLLGEQEADRFHTHSRHSARGARDFPAGCSCRNYDDCERSARSQTSLNLAAEKSLPGESRDLLSALQDDDLIGILRGDRQRLLNRT